VKLIRLNLDALGMCASTLCMIHCLVFPLLLAALPTWKLAAEEVHEVADEGCTERDCCPTASATTSSGDANGRSASCCSTPTDFWIHVGLLAAVAPLGIVAWGAGYSHHRRMGALALGMFGVLLLCGALFLGHHLLGGRGEQVMTVAGSICMVTAHSWNRRQCRCCRAPDLARLVEIEAAAHAPQQLPVIS